MDNAEQLWLLFFDSLMATLVIPPRRPYVLETMLMLGDYDRNMIVVVVVVGSVLGAFLTSMLGKVFSSARKLKGMPEEGELLRFGDKIFRSPYYSFIFIALLVWVPLYGTIVPAIAGFFRAKLSNIAIASLLSFAFYNIYMLLI